MLGERVLSCLDSTIWGSNKAIDKNQLRADKDGGDKDGLGPKCQSCLMSLSSSD